MQKSIKKTLLLSITLLLIYSCNKNLNNQISSNELLQKVDSIFIDFDISNNPGSAILVVKDGDIMLNKGYGLANLEHKISITPSTVFDLASLAKQFTGFAISLLIEQGKISLEDDIRQYIPEFPDFGNTITINQLLHHTSGLRDWTRTLTLAGMSPEDVISFEQILRMAFHQKELNFMPGSQYSYSNTEYNILAEVVQRVTGESFCNWTNQNIFLPLNMTNTQFLDDHTKIINNRANGYYKDDKGEFHINPDNLTALGSSSLYSTTTDLAKWMSFLANPSEEMATAVNRMYHRGILNNGAEISYAFGLELSEFRNTKWISHSGSWASFSTYMVLLPEYKLSIAVLNNHQGSAENIAREIASLYVPKLQIKKDSQEQQIYESVEVSVELLDDYVGTYKFGIGWYVSISRKGNELWSQATNEKKFPMIAESDTTFQIPAYGGRTMTFYRDASGKVTHMEYAGEKRQKEKSPFNTKNITQYLGEYISEELETSYHVISEDDRLKLYHFRHGILNLTPVWQDDFLGSKSFIRSIEFYRDKNDKIIGFYASDTRARYQRFTKK